MRIGIMAPFSLRYSDDDLRLTIRANPREDLLDADLGEASTDLGGERVGERHQLRGLIGRISEHVTLVTGADLLDSALLVLADNRLSDIRRLLLEGNDDVARTVVNSLLLQDSERDTPRPSQTN